MKLFVACKALVFNDNGECLIVREGSKYDEGTNLGRYDVVGGRIEPEETLMSGLAREVKEETGLTVLVRELIAASENFPIIKGEEVHIIRLYYYCETESQKVILSEDHDEYRWIPPHTHEEFDIMDDVKEVFVEYLKNIK
jgi:8-oxo-dGTP diphosphatase